MIYWRKAIFGNLIDLKMMRAMRENNILALAKILRIGTTLTTFIRLMEHPILIKIGVLSLILSKE